MKGYTTRQNVRRKADSPPARRSMPVPLGPAFVQRLQHTLGNQVTGRLLQGGRGAQLPEPLRQAMEQAFVADFRGVRLQQDLTPLAFGAVAVTQGSNIH